MYQTCRESERDLIAHEDHGVPERIGRYGRWLQERVRGLAVEPVGICC
eukprot:COSAG02_NODE_3959_length_5983_cov_9.304176_11_plen_48_part_00